MNNEDKFVGGIEDMSYDFTESEKHIMAERGKRFQAALLIELGGNTNPTWEERSAAIARVLEKEKKSE